MVHTEFNEKHIEGLELVFVELPKFKAQNYTERRIQYLWLKFLTEIGEDTKQIPAELAENSEINEAIGLLQASGFTEDELIHYDKYWDSVRVEATTKEESYTKGEAKGREEGREEGKEEERKLQEELRKQEKYDMAKTLLRNSVDIEIISKTTGLSRREIEKLSL